jgi:EAL domain-containing protein (putative c-di-GMP-specific phosphodiesterase class I)
VDLPAATWKIDRSFTGNLNSRPTAGAVVSAVLQMGSALNRTVVVEGVETHDVVEALRRLGCTHAQGYYLGAPQDPEQFTHQLATTPA